ncbi:PD40 domain-containing protein [Novosphingobium flavum]|uniref:PD40 domain-containing protein n=1 Tax=Novosphingobium flavum TaxID=1778672 RepID=A0A7X1KLF5_9SPHN|nr:amidohydrolase family protein [Novosphingobium flavum]MBC2665534.1 PD40 domain-containing protein [Novosphingobium flavum]
MSAKLHPALAAFALLAGVGAQAAPAARSDRADLPLQPARELAIDARSGTWMSLDLSPDGKTILFDMLGDLYVMPATGGEARQLTRGLAFDSQPTWSPDGRSIAFVSDRSGADNLWVMKADGSGARRITALDDESVLASPAWSADGKALFVSRYYADRNNYELLSVGLGGAISMIAPIRKEASAARGQWQSNLGAAPSADGRYVYFARAVGGLDYDEVNTWNIVRRDLASGAEATVIGDTSERGHDKLTAFRPVLSPDGRYLAYGTRRETTTQLRLRDLATGADRRIAAADPDQLEASMWLDILPRYDFTADGTALIVSHGGGFERIDTASGAVTRLPFHAAMKVAVGPSTRQDIREGSGPVRAHYVQAPIASPDGTRIAFSALGRLYVQAAAPGSQPKQVPTGEDPAFQPGWSPDGKTLAFVTWSEGQGGMAWTVPADGSAPPRKAADLAAYYSYPTFTPDGSALIAVRSPMAARRSATFDFGQLRVADLVSLPLAGGAARIVHTGNIGGRPHFAARADEAYLLSGEGLVAVNLASGAARTVARAEGPAYYFMEGDSPADDLRISPDGKWLIALKNEQLYLAPVPADGALLDLAGNTTVRRLTAIGANFAEWRRDGSIDWSVGSHLRHLTLARALSAAPRMAEGAADTVTMAVEAPRDLPSGSLLLRGARVLTMAGGDRVIEDADLLVTGDRIAAVGPRGSFPIPAGTALRDLAGETIVPGFIDEHDHIAEIRRNVLSLEDWGLRARLAYGVTTSFDPSTLSTDMIAYQDLIDAGQVLGPRLRSTEQAIFSYNRFDSLDAVRAVLHRYRDDYGLANIKEYRTGNRRVRQWMAMAARELGLQPTTEGALSLKLDLTQILDGYAGNEHALPAAPLGEDVIGLMKAMRTSYATTMMITHRGPEGADWFAVHDNASELPRIRQFWPVAAIRQKLARRPGRPLADYGFGVIAAGAARLQREGGLVGMGAHGEVPGIGFHWEMQAHVIGGMTPLEVLHAATAGSAETIGRLHDLGTIEPGKLADLVVFEQDPRENIRNTLGIDLVMRGGHLYRGATLDSVWPVERKLPPPWFAAGDEAEQWLPVPEQPPAH